MRRELLTLSLAALVLLAALAIVAIVMGVRRIAKRRSA